MEINMSSLTLSSRADPARSLVLVTMCLGVLVAQIDTSVVNLALRRISADLAADVSRLQWVVDAYNLAYASLLLSGGVLADLYGRRRIFALGVALFTLGSIICGFAPDIHTLIAGRAVAGIGAALEVPATLAILTVTWPDARERALPLGIWASCNGLAFIIGPTLGGALVDHAGWRSIFLLIVPLCALVLMLTRRVPESVAPDGRRLDLTGQALAILSLGALAFTAIEGPNWGWTAPSSLSAAAVCVVSAICFLRVEARPHGALLLLGLFAERTLSAALAITACMTFGMYAMLFVTPLYLQSVHGASALRAALELLPMSVAFVVVAQLSGPLANRFGARTIICAGMGAMGTGMLMFAVFLGSVLPAIEAALLVIGIGLGLTTAPIQNVAVASVPPERAGTASGLVNTARMVGATLGVAVLGLTLTGDPAAGADFRLAYLTGGAAEWLGAAIAVVYLTAASTPGPSAGGRPSSGS
jgi:DHA2 family methylenomycin A resistance protein-like MFS transporter